MNPESKSKGPLSALRKPGRTASHSITLLLEILIAVLFFSIAGAVCLLTFTKAHRLSQETDALQTAVTESQSVASLLQDFASDTSLEEEELTDPAAFAAYLQDFYPQAAVMENSCLISYDETLQPCSPEQAAYQLQILPLSADSGLTSWQLTFSGCSLPSDTTDISQTTEDSDSAADISESMESSSDLAENQKANGDADSEEVASEDTQADESIYSLQITCYRQLQADGKEAGQ